MTAMAGAIRICRIASAVIAAGIEVMGLYFGILLISFFSMIVRKIFCLIYNYLFYG